MLNATVLSIQVGEHEVHAQTSGDSDLLTGDPVWLTFRRYHVFDKESGVRLHTHPDSAAVTSVRPAGT